MASDLHVNYQHWHGFTDGRFGYGAMLNGFLQHVPDGVVLDPRASVSVHMGVPFTVKGFYEGAHRVLFSMWETTRLPTRFAAWLCNFDQVLVPCQHNVEVFGPYHPNVSHVPLGVDTTLWTVGSRAENQKFRFHAAGSLWWRKGLDIVVRAFANAGLDAELHLKVAPHASDVPKQEWPKGVVFHRQWMDQQQVVDWFRQADCFVAPTRGEGFGLIPLQAIAAGVPTIITASSGQAQFAHLAQVVVPHKSVPADRYGGGNWDEADMDALVEAMRDMFHNRDRHKQQAVAAARRADEFSWGQAAQKLVAALPEGRKLVDPTFVNADVNIKVRVTRRCNPSINGKHRLFVPGEEYTVGEGFYALLRDGGYLAV